MNDESAVDEVGGLDTADEPDVEVADAEQPDEEWSEEAWAAAHPDDGEGEPASDEKGEEPYLWPKDVRDCPRCHSGHDYLVFRQLVTPIRTLAGNSFTHHATCPSTGQPVLMKVQVEGEPLT